MKKKSEYKQILPFDTNKTVQEQFGRVPMSIIKDNESPAYKYFVGDDGDLAGQTRRSDDAKYLPGLRYSEFHPDLARFIIGYWSLKGHKIIDPFAGRATRGLVAAALGRTYTGYEIAPSTQRWADKKIKEIDKNSKVVLADGTLLKFEKDGEYDMAFTCPPYHQLEKYESVNGQLSDIKKYEDFLRAIYKTGENLYRVLKPGAFICWVCADWRDGKAFRTFHVDVTNVFTEYWFTMHDIVIIHNNSPFAALQAAKVASKRYTSKIHEYLLVFRKPL
jgi:DNA modification methylase